MKKFHILPVLSFLLAVCVCSCIQEDTYAVKTNTGSSVVPGIAEDNDVMQMEVFDVLNLDYPGLEAVKANYEQQKYHEALVALLDYYRNRTDVINDNVPLVGFNVTANDTQWSDYAMQGMFQSQNQKIPPLQYLTDGVYDWYITDPDNEVRWQVHRHKWMPPMGKRYRSSGDEKWAQAWKEEMVSWIDASVRGVNTGNDRWAWRMLEVGERIDNWTSSMLYFLPSSNFTPNFLSKLLYNIHISIEFVKANYTPTGNHRTNEAQSVAYAGILFPEMKNAGAWIASGSQVLSEAIVLQIFPDGFQYELDFSYHMGEIGTYSKALDMAVANGKGDLFSADYVEGMRGMTDVVKNLVWPNYTTINMNDTRMANHSKSGLKNNFRSYYRLFPDDGELLWMAEEGKAGTKPTNLTKAFPNAGYYVMRSGWDANSIMMVLQNGPCGSFHSQPDNGTFELYIKGRNFYTDSGCYKYSGDGTTNAERDWFRQTRVHNTMTLDYATLKENTTNRNGKLLKFATQDGTDILVTENQSYTGLKHRRAVFFVDKQFFVIVDEGIGNAAGSVNVNFNMLNFGEIQTGGVNNAVLDAAQFGAHTIFADNNNVVVRSFSPSPMTFAPFTGRVSPTIDSYQERNGCYSVNIAKTAAMDAVRFITVIYPTAAFASAPELSAQFKDAGYSATGASLQVMIGRIPYDLSFTLN